MTDDTFKKKFRLSLSMRTLIGLASGVACGLIFGEWCKGLQIFGEIFVGFLQMTVLPYISISLVASVGRLTPQQAGRLSGRVGITLLILWTVGLFAVVLMASAFPPGQSSAFYSNTLLEAPGSLNLVELFIPTNPFRSLANNWIPAVVIFSIGLGIAVMAMPKKKEFISRLDEWLDILKRLNEYVVRLTPYGVFAIVAAASGTMTIEELARIQAYLLAYSAAVILVFFLLSVLVTSSTPFRYRDVLDVTLQAMITAFATAKLIVVLPMLIEKTKLLFAKHGHEDEEMRSDVDVIYPLIYPIPNLGKLLTMIFIPFAAWFIGGPLDSEDYTKLLGLGSVTYFGKPIIAMPFLLDSFRLPADMFQLFIVADVYCSRLGDVLAVMHLFTVTALGTCATKGILRIQVTHLVVRLGAAVVVAVILHFVLNAWLAESNSTGPSRNTVVDQMQLLRHPSPAVVHDTPPAGEISSDTTGQSGLDAIRASGIIRVGYLKDHLPYSYFNAKGELVGFDIDMAHMLAQELDWTLEFVPFEFKRLASQLDANHFDVAMSGLPITTSNLLNIRYSRPYLDVSVCFVVRDDRRRQFATVASINKLEGIKIAVPPEHYLRHLVKSRFPQVQPVVINNLRDFFQAGETSLDALMIDAESGSAWSFFYPGYCPVVPIGLNVKLPLGFAVAHQDRDLAEFLSQWIELKKQSGELNELYDYWILGQTNSQRSPRWSVLRDVMGIDIDGF